MIEINEYGQLVALHRTLVAAKFVTNGIDPDVPTSPVVADICNQVYDSILELLANDADPKEYLEWENWRKLNSTEEKFKL